MNTIKINATAELIKFYDDEVKTYEIFATDDGYNKNSYFNALLANYLDIFIKTQESKIKSIEKRLRLLSSKRDYRKEITRLARELLYDDVETVNFDEYIVLRPHESLARKIVEVELNNLNGLSKSSFFYYVLYSFSLLKTHQREQIIFKKQYDIIQEAININKKIEITTLTGQLYVVSPYKVAVSLEDDYNYILSAQEKAVGSNKLTRVKEVRILEEDAYIAKEQKYVLDRTLENDPQFLVGLTEEEPIVKLNPEAVKLFESIKTIRPTVKKVDCDKYYLTCSYKQVVRYFTRFGKNAIVVYPQELRDKMRQIYIQGYNANSDNKINPNDLALLKK